MLTRYRWPFPTLTGDWKSDGPALVRTIHDYWLSLERKNALTINEAEITASQGIKFPATQVASADANTLDDYEEGTWTPTVTAGSGTFTSASATGSYTKVGNAVHWRSTITITTNNTAATNVQITLPFTAASANVSGGRQTTSGKMLQGICNAAAASVAIVNYDNTYPGASGVTLEINGTLFV